MEHDWVLRVPPARRTHRAHCVIEVSWVLRRVAEHSPKTSKWSTVVTWGAHADQGSRMQPNAHALVHSVHRAGGTLIAHYAARAWQKGGAV